MDDFGNDMEIHPVDGPVCNHDQWVVSSAAYGGIDCGIWEATYAEI